VPPVALLVETEGKTGVSGKLVIDLLGIVFLRPMVKRTKANKGKQPKQNPQPSANKVKRDRRSRRPAVERSNANFAGSGVIDAPLAMDATRPKVCQLFRAPAHKGSEGRVTGVDFIGTFPSSSTGYTIQQFALNARNAAVFPRLSAIATVWRRYYFKMLRFHLFGIAAATQRGYTAMSSLVTDDLATLVTPTTEAQILNQEQVAIGRPWSYVVHDVNLGGLGLEWYTSDAGDGPAEFGEYIGRAFLGIPSTTADADIEIQVYVEYDVEFCQRIAATLDPLSNPNGGAIVGAGNFAAANILGDTAAVDAQAVGLSVDTSGVITIANAGTYLLTVLVVGTGLTAITSPAGWTDAGSVPNGAGTSLVGTFFKNVVSQGETLGPIAVTATTVTGATVRLAQSPASSLLAPAPRKVDDDFLTQVARLKLRMQEAKLV